MPRDLDDELRQLLPPAPAPVRCRSCGDEYGAHPDGGHCTARVGGVAGGLAAAIPCPCPGFRWVDPGGPPVGSYGSPPELVAGR